MIGTHPESRVAGNAGFIAGIVVLAALALTIRLSQLGRRPMHPDEANQAVRAGLLVETGTYRYDPFEHHGPTLYYCTLPVLWLSGTHELSETREEQLRLVPVVFGVGLILLLPLVADGLGRGPALLAGLLTTISPMMVFYSRYYVQETLLVFFTFATIACAWRGVRRPGLRWAIAAGACLGLMHATKETWVLAGAAMIIAIIMTAGWTRWIGGVRNELGRPFSYRMLLAAVLAAAVVGVLLYSSFGRNWRGPIDSILAFATYWRRGTEPSLHDNPWYFYLQLLLAYHPARGFFWTEGLIAVLALAGMVGALLPNALPAVQQPLPRFLGFYTLVLTALYAAIPYKTPWCALSFAHGMILLAGVGAALIVRKVPTRPLKLVVVLALIAGMLHLGRQCRMLNGRLAADQRNPWVYAHSSTDVLNLAEQLERLAQVAPDGYDSLVHVIVPENYWPLPWYLRHFRRAHVGYWSDPAAWQKDTSGQPAPALILLTGDAQEVVDAHLTAEYDKRMLYGLRPGVLVSVYVRADLWKAFVEAAARR